MRARLIVVLTQVNTYLVLAAAFVALFAAEVAPLLPDGPASRLVQVGATVGAWLGSAAAIVRRSAEVLPEERGILPPSYDN
jgi:hypothetical protein